MTGLRLLPPAGSSPRSDPDLEAHMFWAENMRGLLPSTLRARRWVLERLARGSAMPLREMTEADLLHWERVVVAGLAAQSRKAYITHVSSFFTWLKQTKVIRENPAEALTRPKLGKPLPRPVTEEELREAIASAAPKLRAMIVLGAYAGLRAMEVAQLQWQDITTTVDGRTILHVRAGKGGKDRVVPIGKVVLEALRVHGAGASRGPVFYGRDARRISPNSVVQSVNTHFRRLGIDATSHKLRHRFASLSAPLLDNDLGLLAQLCGWNSIETAKHYVLPDAHRVDKLVTALDRLAGAS